MKREESVLENWTKIQWSKDTNIQIHTYIYTYIIHTYTYIRNIFHSYVIDKIDIIDSIDSIDSIDTIDSIDSR